MKRTIMSFVTLLALLAGATQFYDLLPADVHRFLEEREVVKRLDSKKLKGYRPIYVSPQLINGVEMIDVFIDFNDPSVLDQARALGVQVYAVFDDFATAKIPLDLLEKTAAIPGVVDIEISRWLEMCTDSTLQVTRAGQVLNGEQNGLRQGYDGTGVIVGMIDAGFDYQHYAFRNANDTTQTRIVRVYDLIDSTAHPVYVNHSTYPGRVFMGEEIDTLVTDGIGTHGTHTTSIAAGLHVNGYGGMAPGADIVLCVCRNMEMLVNETDVVNCIKYIYAYADSVGKPCVINLSISTLNGPHDGKDKISKAVAQNTGPGRIYVTSAGNTGNRRQYCSGPATLDKPFSFLLGFDAPGVDDDNSYYYQTTNNDIWVRGMNQRPIVTFHVYDKLDKRIMWESDVITLHGKADWTEFSEYFEPDTSVSTDGYMYALISQNVLTGKFETTINAFNLKSKSFAVDSLGKISSRYQLGVSIYPPKKVYPKQTDSCYVDMWICKGEAVIPPDTIYFNEVTSAGDTIVTAVDNYYSTPNSDATICNYAVNDSIISAGAYNARDSYFSFAKDSVVYFSATIGAPSYFTAYQAPGCGPTGKALPTVLAPGYMVTAAVNRYSPNFGDTDPGLVMKHDDGSLWGVMSGTSMAAPTVAGIIAQWLQANPNLTVGDIKDVIANTAIKDEFMDDRYFRPRMGPNGKIDAMAGIQYILSQMPVEILFGDVNGDGLINVSDVTTLIHYILGLDTPDVIIEASDLNNDGFINVSDVTTLIPLILYN